MRIEKRLKTMYKPLSEDESGENIVEYGLIATFVSLAVVGGMMVVGNGFQGIWQSVANAFRSIGF